MDTIIHQFAVELANGWIDLINEQGLSDLDALSSELLKVNNSVAVELLSALIEKLDSYLYSARDMRSKLGLKVKQRNRSREYLTELGWLKYRRSYYYDCLSNKHLYPIDKMLGISSYERLSPGVSAVLVNSAVDVSMRASSRNVTGGDISAQSVCNKVHSVGILEKEPPTVRREIDELHIFADEDHVSLQDGKNKAVPLVSICEGIQKVSKNRNATVNPVHFTSDMSYSDTLWRNVYAYADKAYNLDKVKKICIHGDGGKWIQKGFNEFGNAIFLLDGYHLQKRLQPFLSPDNSECIIKLLKAGDLDGFKTVAGGIIYSCNDATRKKSLRDNLKYIINQWNGIANRLSEGSVGSCTEAMISHVLSERLSRDPMSWSEDGLNAMAMLRVYIKNGGVVTSEHFRRSNEEKQVSKLADYADEMMKSFLDFHIDTSVFEHNSFSQAKVTPISIIMKSLGSIKTSPDHCKN